MCITENTFASNTRFEFSVTRFSNIINVMFWGKEV